MSIEGVRHRHDDKDVNPAVSDTLGGEERAEDDVSRAPVEALPAIQSGEHTPGEGDSFPVGLTPGMAEHDVDETASALDQRQSARRPRFGEQARGSWLRSMRGK